MPGPSGRGGLMGRAGGAATRASGRSAGDAARDRRGAAGVRREADDVHDYWLVRWWWGRGAAGGGGGGAGAACGTSAEVLRSRPVRAFAARCPSALCVLQAVPRAAGCLS